MTLVPTSTNAFLSGLALARTTSVCETLQGVDIHGHTKYLPDITTRAYQLHKARAEEQRSNAGGADHASGDHASLALGRDKTTDHASTAPSPSPSPSSSRSVGQRGRVKFTEDMEAQALAGEVAVGVAASDALRLETVSEQSGADDGGGGVTGKAKGGGIETDEDSNESDKSDKRDKVKAVGVGKGEEGDTGGQEGDTRGEEGDTRSEEGDAVAERLDRMERMMEVMVTELKRLGADNAAGGP